MRDIQMLGKISMNEISQWVPLVSSLTALVALFVGPFVSFKISKMQIDSPRAQEWRDRVFDLGARYTILATHIAGEVVSGRNPREIEGFIENRILIEKFSILLSDDVHEQKVLRVLGREIWDHLYSAHEKPDEAVMKFDKLVGSFRAQLKKVLNESARKA